MKQTMQDNDGDFPQTSVWCANQGVRNIYPDLKCGCKDDYMPGKDVESICKFEMPYSVCICMSLLSHYHSGWNQKQWKKVKKQWKKVKSVKKVEFTLTDFANIKLRKVKISRKNSKFPIWHFWFINILYLYLLPWQFWFWGLGEDSRRLPARGSARNLFSIQADSGCWVKWQKFGVGSINTDSLKMSGSNFKEDCQWTCFYGCARIMKQPEQVGTKLIWEFPRKYSDFWCFGA